MPRGRNVVTGEQLAQVDNRDPFAAPVWRSPVYRTPEPVIFVVQLLRPVWRVLWFALTHPLLDAVAALVVVDLAGPGLARCRRAWRWRLWRAWSGCGSSSRSGSPGSWRCRCGTGGGGGSTGAAGRPR